MHVGQKHKTYQVSGVGFLGRWLLASGIWRWSGASDQ